MVPALVLYNTWVSSCRCFPGHGDVGENRQPRPVICLMGLKGALREKGCRLPEYILRSITDCPKDAECNDLRQASAGRKQFKE